MKKNIHVTESFCCTPESNTILLNQTYLNFLKKINKVQTAIIEKLGQAN